MNDRKERKERESVADIEDAEMEDEETPDDRQDYRPATDCFTRERQRETAVVSGDGERDARQSRTKPWSR